MNLSKNLAFCTLCQGVVSFLVVSFKISENGRIGWNVPRWTYRADSLPALRACYYLLKRNWMKRVEQLCPSSQTILRRGNLVCGSFFLVCVSVLDFLMQ